MNIPHVIRGDDHKINTFKQMQIYLSMKWDLPSFAHIPLIHTTEGKKLSKRDKASTLDDYKKIGIMPNALRNYLLRLGWSYKDKEIFTLEESIKYFNIEGIGSNLLVIEGVSGLSGGEYTIQPDHTEVGSFIGLAAVTGSELRIRNAGVQYLRMTQLMFEKLGVEIQVEGDDLLIPKKQKLIVRKDPSGGIPKIDDAPWPGFPADLTSIMTVVATQCSGAVLIFEKMFESRLFWVDKLIEMGAQIILCDPHRAVISGPTPLKGARVSSPDIRAGMALLIAALGAKGITEIHNIDQIDRGYETIDKRLNALGAKIQRVSE